MRFYLKRTGLWMALLTVVIVGAGAASATFAGTGSTPTLKGPQAVFPETKYTFEPIFEGVDVTHDFVVENRGNAPLVIKKVKPG